MNYHEQRSYEIWLDVVRTTIISSHNFDLSEETITNMFDIIENHNNIAGFPYLYKELANEINSI